MTGRVVIVGAGQAGVQTAASLREGGYRGRIVLVGDEPCLPYHRPPLSKAYLAGKVDRDDIALRAAEFFEQQTIELRSGTAVRVIDRNAAHVELGTREVLPYDHLVLAIGSRNRPLPVPGADLAGVHQLRSMADADALRLALGKTSAIAVIGAGFIGLEFAAIAAERGIPTTVVEATGRPMARALSSEMSHLFRGSHERTGVRFAFEAAITGFAGRNGRVIGVETVGNFILADLVLIGIGVVPNTGLAASARLAVDDGILTDAQLVTSDPAISAVGDCTRFPSRFAPPGFVRIESVQNSVDQARAVATRLLGRPKPYDAVPLFWSDQGLAKLQIAGLATPHDHAILLGGPDAGGASVLRFRADVLVAVESVNRPAEHMAARRLLAQAPQLSPEEARSPDFDLRAHARRILAGRQPAVNAGP